MSTKILIYGFKPFQGLKENITEKIIENIKNRKNLRKVVFPVKFEKKMFLNEIKEFEPDIILGLGLHPRGKKIRIERKAVNLKQFSKKDIPKPIYKNKPKYLFATLKLKRDKESWISYDAGKYVCNFSMYTLLEFTKNKNIKFAFLHIPKDYNLNKAVKFVGSKIDEIVKDLKLL